ncbi:hypothetical protein LJC19_05095, partial [Oxalobacter sp. OttesenSCG-928-P03]|nr:hypothetical protein [Oxalobacter sp. OttesenSCG-928-P03]
MNDAQYKNLKQNLLSGIFSADLTDQVAQESLSRLRRDILTARQNILYRYRSNSQFYLKEIQSGLIWLAISRELNDPFECCLYFDKRLVFQTMIAAKPPSIPEDKMPEFEQALFRMLDDQADIAANSIGV